MFEIVGKTAVIVGGGRGIGAAIVKKLALKHAHVYIIDTNIVEDEFNHYESTKIDGYDHAYVLAEQLTQDGYHVTALNIDACKEISMLSAIGEIHSKCGQIDILVNAIGVTQVSHTVTSSTIEFRSMIETNLIAPYVSCREVAKLMLADGNSGSIINISSISGKMAFPGIPAYCASKFGLVGFTVSLALELAEKEIQVNAICPGIVKTNMWSYLERIMTEKGETSAIFWKRMLEMIPQRKVQTADDIADFVVSVIQNDAITGQSFSVDGGMNRYG